MTEKIVSACVRLFSLPSSTFRQVSRLQTEAVLRESRVRIIVFVSDNPRAYVSDYYFLQRSFLWILLYLFVRDFVKDDLAG